MIATDEPPVRAGPRGRIAPTYAIADRGARGLQALRDRAADLSDVEYPGAADDFCAAMSAQHLSSAIVLEMRVPHVRYDRSPLHVARSGLDQYLIVTYLRGESHVRQGGGDRVMAAGDVGVLDLALPHRSAVVPPADDPRAHHITLLVPRDRLAPLLAAPDALGCAVVGGDTGVGRLLHAALVELWRSAGTLRSDETEGVLQAIAALIAAGVRPAHSRDGHPGALGRLAGCAAIKQFLDAWRDAPDEIDVAALCRRFGVSRASLYRMFEADGGVASYVRRRQLCRALDLLASPAHRHLRVVDIALRHGFRTESGFIKAFRRGFGITPGDVRGASASRAAVDREHGAAAWLAELAAAGAPGAAVTRAAASHR